MKEHNVLYEHIGKEMNYVTFEQFIEHATGEKFSEIYKDNTITNIIKEEKNDKKSNVE